MRQEETDFNAKVKKQLIRRMPHAWIIKVQMVALRGIPDILIFANSRFAVIEGKMDVAETLNPAGRAKLQDYNIKKARSCGGYGAWITPCTYNKVLKEVEDFLYRD